MYSSITINKEINKLQFIIGIKDFEDRTDEFTFLKSTKIKGVLQFIYELMSREK